MKFLNLSLALLALGAILPTARAEESSEHNKLLQKIEKRQKEIREKQHDIEKLRQELVAKQSAHSRELVAALRRQLGVDLVIGGDPSQMERELSALRNQLDGWCTGISQFLKKQRQEASRAVSEERYADAIAIVRDALYAAGETVRQDPYEGGPITNRMIWRGVNLSYELENSLASEDLLTRKSLVLALLAFVDFVTGPVSDFDRSWQLPRLYRYRGPDSRDPYAYERALIHFAREEIKFVINNERFASVAYPGIYHEGSVRPVGRPATFLGVAENFSAYAALDIGSSVYVFERSDAVRRLLDLHDDLRVFNAQMRDTPDSPRKVREQLLRLQAAFIELSQVNEQLGRTP